MSIRYAPTDPRIPLTGKDSKMSRIPSFPFRVMVTKKPMHGSTVLPPIENHNYESLAGAISYRDTALCRPNTRKVEVVMVLDETTPSTNRSNGNGLLAAAVNAARARP